MWTFLGEQTREERGLQAANEVLGGLLQVDEGMLS